MVIFIFMVVCVVVLWLVFRVMRRYVFMCLIFVLSWWLLLVIIVCLNRFLRIWRVSLCNVGLMVKN